MKKIFLVDVSSLFFRAFYAVRPLSSPSGVPVNAIYGFLSMVLKLMKDHQPEYIVFCYDQKEPSFRKEIYDGYKANRTEMPEDLVPQIPYIKKLADFLGIPSVEKLGFEADDLIGTLAELAHEKQFEVFIVSGDKDFGQLIRDGVYLLDTMKNIQMDSKAVEEKWGVPPRQFIDFLALVGDSSDNVPGVAGVGPKGAQKLLEEFDTLENIYENLDKISSKSLKEKLITSKENAFLSKKLVKIVTDVDLTRDLSKYKRRPFLKEELSSLLNELNFKSFEKTIWSLDLNSDSNMPSVLVAADKPEAPNLEDEDSTRIDMSALEPQLNKNQELWGVCCEGQVFLGLQDQAYQYAGDPLALGKLSDKYQIKWMGHDLKNFFHLIQPKKPIVLWDSMLAGYVIRSGDSTDFDKVYARLTGEPFPEIPSAQGWIQALRHLKEILEIDLKRLHSREILEKIDFPLVSILYLMEQRGICLDIDLLSKQSKELSKELQSAEKDIHEMAGESFNVASPKQLSHILFDKLKLPPGKKTKTGFSTDNEVLEGLKDQHPIAEKILIFREVSKLKSTYVDSLPQLLGPDGRIHTHFNQAATTTGRLSSTDPNLQNIPIRTERGARVRRAFIAQSGLKLLSVDYSQIELRVLAHFSEDTNLIKAFKQDLDIHAATASEVFSVDLHEVTPDMRRTAKAVNFGIAYGQGAYGLADTLGIPRGEASEIIKRYFEKFSGVKTYIEETIKKARHDGYVEMLSGRRRYIDELNSNNPAIQKFGERAAINAPIQGTASDIVKKAMIELHKKVPVPMLLQVHDELIFEGSEEELNKFFPEIKKIMESIESLNVPLKVNLSIGDNWDEAH